MRAVWGLAMLAGVACAAGTFMKPQEFRAAMKAPAPPRLPGDLARRADADKAPRNADGD